MGAPQQAAFPEIDGHDFVRSSEVEAVAGKVLELHGAIGGVPRLHPIAEAVRDEELRILWLMNEKPFNDETEDDQEPEIAGRCVKAPKLWRDITGIDVAIWVRKHFWDSFGIELRRAVLMHELLHIEVKRDKDGQAKFAIRKHDVEDFVDVARQYGPSALAGEGARYVRASALFAGEPEPAMRGRSTKAKTSSVAAIAHAVVDAVVADPAVRASDHATIDADAEALSHTPTEPCPFAGCTLSADHVGDHVFDEGGEG